MSPRNYFFQAMNPDVAKDYHDELSTFIPNVYRSIKNFFVFTPKFENNNPKDKEEK